MPPDGIRTLSLRFALAAASLGLLAVPTFLQLAPLWAADPNYTQGWLVAPLAGYLFWRALAAVPRGTPHAALGAAELAAGGLIHLAALVVPWPLLDFAGFFLMLRGLLLTLGGNAWAGAGLVPSLFLLFMFPLPVAWTGAAAVWLQDQVSWLSAGVLNLVWVCLRQGNALSLAGVEQPLVVAEACSGLKQLAAFLGLALLLGALLGRPGKQTFVLVLLAVPCALAANVARVLLMAAGARWFGVSWLSGWLHDLPALFTLPLGFALLLALLRALPTPPAAAPDAAAPPEPLRSPSLVLGVLLGLVAAQTLLLAHLEAAPTAPAALRAPLAAFPLALPTRGATWHGQPNDLKPDLVRQLSFADAFLHRRYAEPEAQLWANIYAAWSAVGADREHHPEICVRDVGGASEEVAARRLVSLGHGAQAQRFRFRTKTQPSFTVYYWHYTAPPAADGPRSFLQRLHARHRQRPGSMTVQVTTALPPERLEALEADLLPAVHEAARRLAPAEAKVGSDRLPIRLSLGD